jgi:hypothetical protein
MANTIKILTTLEYLGTYPDKDAKSHHYFGIVLQAGVPADQNGKRLFDVGRDQTPLLQPWYWDEPEVVIFPLNADHTLGTPLKLEAEDAHKKNPSLDPTHCYVLNASIVNPGLHDDFENAFNAQDFAWPGPTSAMQRDPARTQYPWPAYLAQVSRYPFPIPHLLNLAYIVKVHDSVAPVKGTSYVAAVKFEVNLGGKVVRYTPNPSGTHPDRQPSSGGVMQATPDGRLCIPYHDASDDSTLETCTVPLALPDPLNMMLTSALAEGSDWQAHLVPGCADIFDFPTRVIDAIRKDCKDKCGELQAAVAKEFSALVTAVLNAQRNIVSFGYQKCPNRKSLLNRLFDRWVGEGRQAESKSRSKFAKQFVDQIQGQLEHDQASDSNQNQAYCDWLDLLRKNARLANHALLSAAPSSVAVERVSDKLVELEHVQSQFSQSEVLEALLLAQWEQWTKKNPKVLDLALYQSFRASATAAMDNLNVRDLLLQGNLGGKLENGHSTVDNASWDTIATSVNGTASRDVQVSRGTLIANIKKECGNRLSSLLDKLPVCPPASNPPVPNPAIPTAQLPRPGFAGLLQDAVQILTNARVDALIPARTNGSAADQPPPAIFTRTSEGLSIMLEGLSSGDDSDANDSLRTMSGLCVLIRDRPLDNSITDWRCLNVGDPMTTPPSGVGQPKNLPVHAVAGLTDPVVVPVPLHNQDDLRRAILTYNNQPLMSESPAHGFSKGLVPTPAGARDRLIAFQHPSVSADLDLQEHSPWKIPGLAFGHTYDLLIGRVSNSGALPPAFADPVGGPAILSLSGINAKMVSAKSQKKTSGQQKQSALVPSISGVPYKRTVPIADLRFGVGARGDKNTGPARLDLPPIPTDVHPRASELYPSPDISAAAADSMKDRPAFPLVMLTPYKSKLPLKSQSKASDSFTMGIRKPTTDLLTWDRWMAAKGLATQNDRINAWTGFHYLARQENRNYDLALDDPAVQSLKIEIEINAKQSSQQVYTKDWGKNKILDWKLNNSSAPTSVPTPTSVQIEAPALPLTIQTSELATASTFDSGTWTLTLRPGDIAKLTLTPTVKDDNNCFATGLPSAPGYTFLAEAALQDIPSADDLRAALHIKPPSVVSSTTVDFELRLDAVKNHEQVRAVDLQTQLWRWDGRPSPLFPFNNGSSPGVLNQPSFGQLEWELETFSTRLASDATVRPMARRGSLPSTSTQASAQAKASSSNADAASYFFVAHDDRETELGATFYRAGVTAYNRYGSLVPENPPPADIQGTPQPPPTRSVSTLTTFASVPGADGGWVRQFVPARLPATVSNLGDYKPPKPAIKFIVPLTEATDNSQPTQASVLIVVQGPWYAIAGLAEDICVHVTNSDPIPDPEHPGKTLIFPEAGPDPIWFDKARGDLPTEYQRYSSVYTHDPENSGFHGPVGHTFDSFDDDPLWVNCSFVLDPPKPVKGDLGRSSFACVQFQRIIRGEGLVFPDKDGKLVAPPAGTKIQSVPTDPLWIQFLPSQFSAFGDRASELSLEVAGQTASIKRKDAIIRLSDAINPGQTKEHHLVFGLLLTEEVEDLLGRKRQERFVDFLVTPATGAEAKAASWKYPTPQNPLKPSTAKLIGRIVAIERQVNVSPFIVGDSSCGTSNTPNIPFVPTCDLADYHELWKELFPDGDRDAVARIVAVSPPIAKSISLTCDQPGVKS